jgi:RNA polymerase sigma factor (sigma-70 family)
LLNKNFKRGPHTFDQAITCATDAAVQVSRAHFPYDTEFEPWVHVLLRNVCFGYLRGLKKERALNDNLVDLNELLEIIPAESGTQWLAEAQITRQELEEAINRLQEVRQIVIREHHFKGRSLAEIAADIDKSPNNVYQIHYRALDDLRKILEQKGYI